ncbi:MAG: 2OG-Fe(II) oxygenase [Comamonas sp.]
MDRLDWAAINAELDAEGYALLPGLLGTEAARGLARQIVRDEAAQRMPLAELGRGELLAWSGHLPPPLQAWRAAFHPHLVAIANRWRQALGEDGRLAAAPGGGWPPSQASRLGVEGWMALRQGSEGGQGFPLQLVVLLSEPGVDFDGGEFVMTEQRPRMQSRPMVLPLRLGDAALIGAAARPVWGAHGCYRVQMRHAISRVRRGERIGVELGW